MINGSVTGSAINQIPLVNSTQILTSSAQVPMGNLAASTPVITASTPVIAASTPVLAAANPSLAVPAQGLVASTPVMVGTPGLVASTPVVSPNIGGHLATTSLPTQSFVPEEDYRLGRGILDDFRPGGYKSIVGVVSGNNAGLGVVNSQVAASTPIVNASTPVVSSAVGNINDFL